MAVKTSILKIPTEGNTDIINITEKVSGEIYAHDQTWHDGNGHSHLRSTLLGPSLTVPFAEKNLILGTWQQIILIDFDNRKREREIIIQLIGD